MNVSIYMFCMSTFTHIHINVKYLVQTAHLVVCPPEGFQIVSIQFNCFILSLFFYQLIFLFDVLVTVFIVCITVFLSHSESKSHLPPQQCNFPAGINCLLSYYPSFSIHNCFGDAFMIYRLNLLKSALYKSETLIRYPQCSYSLLLLGIFRMKVLLNIPLITEQKCSIIQE